MNELSKGTYLKDGKYRIESVLGQGAFGITYLATAKLKVSENLGSMNISVKVAVKEFFMHDINQRSEGETAITGTESETAVRYREKFRKEAENLSRMNHPNIVKVLEVFDENNTTYYVMENIEGCSMDEYILQQKGIMETEALSIIKDIADALSYMHDHKMLHLDLKPKNIMRDREGNIRLIDFGLSKQYNENGEPESSTSIGLGTPGYAPIEQANYTQDGTFPATLDIYALGATLYKMITAETPPKASKVLEDGLDILLLREKKLSEFLIMAILKAMSPKKKDRPQSVSEFMALLEKDKTDLREDVQIADDSFIEKHYDNREETELNENKTQDKVVIFPDTDQIEFCYWGGSIPPPYQRWYEVIISQETIKVKVHCHDKLMFDGAFPFDSYKFFALLGLITSLDIHMIPLVKSCGADGCESLSLTLSHQGKTYLKVFIYGNEYVIYEGTTNANLYLIKKEIERLVPNFQSIYAQEQAFDISNITKETITVNGISFNMVYVEGGTFVMGNDSEKAYGDDCPAHKMSVKSFYIGEMQVTQSLWETVMGSNPSQMKLPNGPVESVSWYDCQEFVDRLNKVTGRMFRLPTEAEWEYAARGGDRGHNFIYSGSNRAESVGWFLKASHNGIRSVGQKFPNELGIFDMSGNVYEWCESKYVSYKKGIRSFVANIKEKNRVIRGGSWRDFPDGNGVTARYSADPADKDESLGLRLAMSV